MAKSYIYWKYKGHGDDRFYFYPEHLVEKLPGKTRLIRQVSYLTRKGFGWGYYNSSYVYSRFYKTTLNHEPTAEELATFQNMGIEVFANLEIFKMEVERMIKHEKKMHKQNPY